MMLTLICFNNHIKKYTKHTILLFINVTTIMTRNRTSRCPWLKLN